MKLEDLRQGMDVTVGPPGMTGPARVLFVYFNCVVVVMMSDRKPLIVKPEQLTKAPLIKVEDKLIGGYGGKINARLQ
jgi:hypothetical protein